MLTWLANVWSLGCKFIKFGAPAVLLTLFGAASVLADEAGEANLKLPDLSQVTFLGIDGHKLLLFGIVICIFGLGFGLAIYSRLKNLPVHKSMREISELIYETCKTYLFTQGKFLLILWVFIAVVIVMYFGWLAPVRPTAVTLPIILIFSLVGIAGSYGVAWFGIRVNTFANSRTAFASLRGKPYPIYSTPLQAGMSIGMMLISVELRSEEHTSELQSQSNIVCRLLLEKKKSVQLAVVGGGGERLHVTHCSTMDVTHDCKQ